jgi:hypothetical protein
MESRRIDYINSRGQRNYPVSRGYYSIDSRYREVPGDVWDRILGWAEVDYYQTSPFVTNRQNDLQSAINVIDNDQEMSEDIYFHWDFMDQLRADYMLVQQYIMRLLQRLA